MRTQEHYTWRKLSSSKWEDVWPERLSEFADRLAITTFPNRRTIRVEIFALEKRDAERLRQAFGGSVSVQRKDWMKAPSVPRPPINVRGKLLVVASPAERDAMAGKRPVLLIPAGMAFGTGEHATTATCLRLLADVAAQRADTRWEMLDLGCGSGILALAARLLGAARVEAGDFDLDCVRIAKENAAANGIRGAAIRKLDVLTWEPARTWPVITANLFSRLHIAIASKLAKALSPDGRLIFSGILWEQEEEVAAAFRKAGLRILRRVWKGKWVTGVAVH